MSFQHGCFSLCPILLFGCPAWPGGMLTPFDQVFIISDCDARLSEGPGWGGKKRGLRVQEASPQRTEKSPGIPPALMRSILVCRGPQAASARWNARPLSLTALLRAISNSLSEWLTGQLYQLGDSWYVCYCQTLFEIALLSFTVAFGFYLCSHVSVCMSVSLCVRVGGEGEGIAPSRVIKNLTNQRIIID